MNGKWDNTYRSCNTKSVYSIYGGHFLYTTNHNTSFTIYFVWSQGNQVHLRLQRSKQGSKKLEFFLSICFVFANLELEPQKLIDALEFQSQLCFSWCMRKENRGEKKIAFHHSLGLRRPNKSINLKMSVQSLGHWALLPGTNTYRRVDQHWKSFTWSLSKCLNTAPQRAHKTLSFCHSRKPLVWFQQFKLPKKCWVKAVREELIPTPSPQAGQALS